MVTKSLFQQNFGQFSTKRNKDMKMGIYFKGELKSQKYAEPPDIIACLIFKASKKKFESMPTKKTIKPKVKSTTAKPKSDKIHSSLQKQIKEVRDSTIALYNILEKQGITNEKEFMREYQKLSSKK